MIFKIFTSFLCQKTIIEFTLSKYFKTKRPPEGSLFDVMIINYLPSFNTLVTNSAASFNKIAEYTCKPDLSINSLASAAFVP